MHKTSKNLTRILLAAMLLASLLCLSSCIGQKVVVIPADRVVTKLPDGNYEVTPAWLQERYQLERWQKEEIKRCGK